MDPLVGWAPTQPQQFWQYPQLFRQTFHPAKLVFGAATAGNMGTPSLPSCTLKLVFLLSQYRTVKVEVAVSLQEEVGGRGGQRWVLSIIVCAQHNPHPSHMWNSSTPATLQLRAALRAFYIIMVCLGKSYSQIVMSSTLTFILWLLHFLFTFINICLQQVSLNGVLPIISQAGLFHLYWTVWSSFIVLFQRPFMILDHSTIYLKESILKL